MRGKYFVKEVFLCLLFIALVCILHEHVDDNTTPDLIIIIKKKLADLWTLLSRQIIIRLKENEKKKKYPELIRELRKLWNMKVTIILIVIGAFSTVTKG